MTSASESSRLREIYSFSDAVVETVERVAAEQRITDWARYSADTPNAEYFTPTEGKPIEVLDIVPNEYDDTLVYHLPMGNGLDDNMTARLVTLARANPTKRIIAAGNPGAPGSRSGRLSLPDVLKVARGDLRPTAGPMLEYLHAQGIEEARHIGFSYGADKAPAAATYAERYDQTVTQGIFMEPASVKDRNILGLAGDFGSTAAALEGYVSATESDAYLEARDLASKRNHGLVGYSLGLLRASNIAIAQAIASNGFEQRVLDALTAQPEMRADIIWGSESELAIHGLMMGITDKLWRMYPAQVRVTTLRGQKHAFGDDIFLHTATILQALEA